ncbi:MAG: DUF4402 domain-containing protein, partial [Alphaproteobacteria bacterium]|nr:DUF4402 domain-containing protein [Alphaproteobacteria bacterium]
TGQIGATIVHPVALNDTADMSFGWLARPASPGIAVIAPAGRRVLSSNLTLIRQDGATSAKIVISGSPNQALGLLVGDIARFGRPGKKIEVLGFTHNAGPFPALDLNGRTTIELGATLHLAADINNGRYKGVFDVIVSNN